MADSNPPDANATKPTVAPTPDPPPVDPGKLTPEEQMERYEQALKESDWGHQPC